MIGEIYFVRSSLEEDINCLYNIYPDTGSKEDDKLTKLKCVELN